MRQYEQILNEKNKITSLAKIFEDAKSLFHGLFCHAQKEMVECKNAVK